MQFDRTASLFPHQLDVINDRVLLVPMGEQEFRDASFLDQRLLTQNRQMQWADWTQLEAASAGWPADAHFIFHIGHVGSTLISRLLGELDGLFALREPQLLRNFAELAALDGRPESPWPPDRFDPRLETALGWLSRTFRPQDRALIKATSFASEIDGRCLGGKRKALFLTLSPQRYIETILAGENSRQELAMLSGPRLVRLHRRIGAEPWALWDMPEATRAAMGWACEMSALETAAEANTVKWLDFDAFLAAPGEHLTDIATFFGVDADRAAIDALVSGPLMQRYSKAPEHGYSKALREQVLEQARRERSGDIAEALRWLDAAAADHPVIASALARVAKD